MVCLPFQIKNGFRFAPCAVWRSLWGRCSGLTLSKNKLSGKPHIQSRGRERFYNAYTVCHIVLLPEVSPKEENAGQSIVKDNEPRCLCNSEKTQSSLSGRTLKTIFLYFCRVSSDTGKSLQHMKKKEAEYKIIYLLYHRISTVFQKCILKGQKKMCGWILHDSFPPALLFSLLPTFYAFFIFSMVRKPCFDRGGGVMRKVATESLG